MARRDWQEGNRGVRDPGRRKEHGRHRGAAQEVPRRPRSRRHTEPAGVLSGQHGDCGEKQLWALRIPGEEVQATAHRREVLVAELAPYYQDQGHFSRASDVFPGGSFPAAVLLPQSVSRSRTSCKTDVCTYIKTKAPPAWAQSPK